MLYTWFNYTRLLVWQTTTMSFLFHSFNVLSFPPFPLLLWLSLKESEGLELYAQLPCSTCLRAQLPYGQKWKNVNVRLNRFKMWLWYDINILSLRSKKVFQVWFMWNSSFSFYHTVAPNAFGHLKFSVNVITLHKKILNGRNIVQTHFSRKNFSHNKLVFCCSLEFMHWRTFSDKIKWNLNVLSTR